VIALDTSALIAILKNEPMANACAAVLEIPDRRVLLSAGTLLELRIVALQKQCSDQLSQLIASLNLRLSTSPRPAQNAQPPPTSASARTFTPHPSTSAIASPMPRQRNSTARCSMSATTSPALTFAPHSPPPDRTKAFELAKRNAYMG
jgi:uncharacterized protein with PIN domain